MFLFHVGIWQMAVVSKDSTQSKTSPVWNHADGFLAPSVEYYNAGQHIWGTKHETEIWQRQRQKEGVSLALNIVSCEFSPTVWEEHQYCEFSWETGLIRHMSLKCDGVKKKKERKELLCATGRMKDIPFRLVVDITCERCWCQHDDRSASGFLIGALTSFRNIIVRELHCWSAINCHRRSGR